MFIRYYSILLAICFCLTSEAQTVMNRFDNEVFDALKFKPFTLDIKTSNDLKDLYFNTVLIKDQRPDTTKLGFTRAGREKFSDHRFVFPADQTNWLTKKINKLFSNNTAAGDTLVLHLNNLWLFETRRLAGFFKREMMGDSEDLVSNCYIQCDVYLLQGGSPVFIGKVDTTVSDIGWLTTKCNAVLRTALRTTLMISHALVKNMDGGDNAMKPAGGLDYPILSATQPKKGIYLTYKSFLDNRPDIAEFTAEAKTMKRFLKSPRIPDSAVAKCWGYSDGTAIYMNIDNDFYRLNRSNNAFDLRGPAVTEIRHSTFNKIFSTTTSFAILGGPFVDLSAFLEPEYRKIVFLKFLQLDIRDGVLR